MNNQRAIDRLTKHLEWGWSEETVDAIEMGIHALKETQWIPCSERLPERDGAYQLKEFAVTINDGGRVYASHASYDFEAHKWIYHNGKIVAWMPLPKPYKEGKDE